METSFLNKQDHGINTFRSYFFGALIIFFTWRVIGGLQFLYFIYLFQSKSLFSENLSDAYAIANKTFIEYPIWSYIIMHTSFILGFFGVWYVIKKLHHRSLLSLISLDKFNVRLFIKGLGTIFSLISISFIINFLISPTAFPLNPSLNIYNWIGFLFLSTALTGIQILVEELIFRGYLLQGIVTKSNSILLASVVSITLFTLMHLYLPGATDSIVPTLSYFAFGLLTTLLTIKQNGLESSIAFHFGLNMFYVTILSFANSTYPINALFLVSTDKLNFVADFILQIMIFVGYYLIMIKSSKSTRLV